MSGRLRKSAIARLKMQLGRQALADMQLAQLSAPVSGFLHSVNAAIESALPYVPDEDAHDYLSRALEAEQIRGACLRRALQFKLAPMLAAINTEPKLGEAAEGVQRAFAESNVTDIGDDRCSMTSITALQAVLIKQACARCAHDAAPAHTACACRARKHRLTGASLIMGDGGGGGGGGNRGRGGSSGHSPRRDRW